MNPQIGDLLRDVSAHVTEVDLAERAWVGAETRRARRRSRAMAMVAAAAALLIASGVYLASAQRGGPALPSAPSRSTTATTPRVLPDGTPYVVVPTPDALASLDWRDVGLPEVADATGTLPSWRGRTGLAGWDDPDVAAFLKSDGSGGLSLVLATRRGLVTIIDDLRIVPLTDGKGGSVSPLGPRAISPFSGIVALAQPGKVVVVETRGPDSGIREIPVPAPDLQSVGWVSSGDSGRVMIARSVTKAWRIVGVPESTAYTVTPVPAGAYEGDQRFERPSGSGVLRRFQQGLPGATTAVTHPLVTYSGDTVGNGAMVAAAGGIGDSQTATLPVNLSEQAVLAVDLADGLRPTLAVLAAAPERREGCCQVLGWADRTTVLFQLPFDGGSWVLAWDVSTGRIERVSRLTGIGEPLALALNTGQRR